MLGPFRTSIRLATILFLLLSARVSAQSQTAVRSSRSAVTSGSKLFHFHSAFWINLHHFLYVQARARMNTADSRRASVAKARDDLEKLTELNANQRSSWEAALEYYQRNLASRDLVFDDSLIAVTNELAASESKPSLKSSGLDPKLQDVLMTAAPVYRAVWWPAHDRANRAWVAAMIPLLGKYGSALSEQVSRAFQISWPTKGFRVDVCAYSNWAGAYTTASPAHITFASTSPQLQDANGLETLFHEPVHVFDEQLDAALQRQAAAQGKSVPRQLSHAMIFYTAGELTRRAIPDHVPYAKAYGIWKAEPWNKYLKALDANWLPHLDGKIDFDESLKRLVGEL